MFIIVPISDVICRFLCSFAREKNQIEKNILPKLHSTPNQINLYTYLYTYLGILPSV